MIDMAVRRLPRGTLFVAFNLGVALFVALFIVTPLWSHFAERSDEIAESIAQLSHVQALSRQAKAVANEPGRARDPFLAGSEEGVVSADLQASLKTIATDAGVRLLAIRGVPATGVRQPRMVAVDMELEGASAAIRNLLMAIDNQMPLLFVTAASLRSVTDGDDGMIRADLKVQGAMRSAGSPADAAEGARR